MRLLALTLLILAAPAPAASAQLLDPADNEELAQSLAEATDAQGVCYGWEVAIFDASAADSRDAGSSLGPGEPLPVGDPRCPKYVVLKGGITYTAETSESEDAAVYHIESNLQRPPTVDELRDLGHGPGRLLDSDDDEALTNAVGALPLLVADHGEAKPVGFEPGNLPPEQAGEPTGSTGSDFLRENWAPFVLCLLLVLGGGAWFVRTLLTLRTSNWRP